MQENYPYDYLIVGAGLFGMVFAHEARKKGKKCLLIDRRSHIGGNIYTENHEGIHVHKYGAHIFHTQDKHLWDYVNNLTPFNHYRHTVMATYKGKIFSLPFNMHTFSALWGTLTPQEAKAKIDNQIQEAKIKNIHNLEEQAIQLIGHELYNILVKGYTEKQWGQAASSLPSFIIRRLPLRFTYNNLYFDDAYQGIPKEGYSALSHKLIEGCEIILQADYFKEKSEWDKKAKKIIYTGAIDQFYAYEFGKLNYRSLRFEEKKVQTPNFQGVSVMNYTDADVPYTRIIEHKHFTFGTQDFTIITHEYPEKYTGKNEPYYPINDDVNQRIFKQYEAKSLEEKRFIFGGRLAEYRYYDMHQVIASALKKANQELSS